MIEDGFLSPEVWWSIPKLVILAKDASLSMVDRNRCVVIYKDTRTLRPAQVLELVHSHQVRMHSVLTELGLALRVFVVVFRDGVACYPDWDTEICGGFGRFEKQAIALWDRRRML